MKKLLTSLSVLGCLFFASCQKDEVLVPDKQLIKADKGVMCRGCGDWDIIGTSTQSLDSKIYSTDTLSSTSKSTKPSRKNK